MLTVTDTCCYCSHYLFQKPLLLLTYNLAAPHAGRQEIQRQTVIWESEDLGAVPMLLVALLPLCTMKQQSSHWRGSEQKLLVAQKSSFDLLFTRCKGSSASLLGSFIASSSLLLLLSPYFKRASLPFFLPACLVPPQDLL